VAEQGEVAYFMGCLPQFETMFSQEYGVSPLDIARSAIRLLNHLGIEPVVAADERCCGHDQLWNGEPQAFKTLAKANAETFKARGVKHILTTCAECHRTWKVDMAEEVGSYKPKVQHLGEFMAEQVAAGKLSFAENGSASVTFQDACRLAHHQGVYEPLREVVRAMPGTSAVEMKHSKRNAQCCGTSGFMFCDAASRRLQDGRLAEAAATGAQRLLTSCPKCYIHLSCAQAGAKRRGDPAPVVEVTDLTVFAASRLKESGGDKAPRAKSQGTGETS
jgi:Fe-S oxidoreductase